MKDKDYLIIVFGLFKLKRERKKKSQQRRTWKWNTSKFKWVNFISSAMLAYLFAHWAPTCFVIYLLVSASVHSFLIPQSPIFPSFTQTSSKIYCVGQRVKNSLCLLSLCSFYFCLGKPVVFVWHQHAVKCSYLMWKMQISTADTSQCLVVVCQLYRPVFLRMWEKTLINVDCALPYNGLSLNMQLSTHEHTHLIFCRWVGTLLSGRVLCN